MAEWLLRGTVNTFFRGSIPLDAYFLIFLFLFNLSYNKFIYGLIMIGSI
jgi:hypothetical protein